ncbi:MAG: dephospho-CoA kinase [Clostridia bacterium]|nr:dephospho-CoA kinase [Clostridia bacterium]
MNRAALGSRVFSNPDDKSLLESILHPMIFDEIDSQLDSVPPENIAFADIPLLFECNMESKFDETWTVTLDPQLQLERLMARDHITAEAAQARIQAQMSQREKAARATRCISTDGTPEETAAIVDALLTKIISQKSPSVPHDSPRRRIRSVPIETIDSQNKPARPKTIPASSKKNRLLDHIPKQTQRILFGITIAILTVCMIFATRAFIQHQAEQRRLAAEAAERAQHPLYYGDLIIAYSAQQKIDPALVSAVILCESSYNPQAVSRLGARGLMQLMEDTAAWIAHKLKEDTPSYSFDLLFEPDTNIRFGTWYLGFLSRRYGGDAKKIVCAYHAGQGNVDAWLKNPEYSKDGVTLTIIPTKDTSAYASRVLKARDIYQKYYFAAETDETENDPART